MRTWHWHYAAHGLPQGYGRRRMFARTGPGSWRLFPGSASSWVILALNSLYCKGKIKTTEHFKLQMWLPAQNTMCHFLYLPRQHCCYLIYTNCSTEGQRGICGRGGFPDRSLNFQSPLVTTSLSPPSHQEP